MFEVHRARCCNKYGRVRVRVHLSQCFFHEHAQSNEIRTVQFFAGLRRGEHRLCACVSIFTGLRFLARSWCIQGPTEFALAFLFLMLADLSQYGTIHHQCRHQKFNYKHRTLADYNSCKLYFLLFTSHSSNGFRHLRGSALYTMF